MIKEIEFQTIELLPKELDAVFMSPVIPCGVDIKDIFKQLVGTILVYDKPNGTVKIPILQLYAHAVRFRVTWNDDEHVAGSKYKEAIMVWDVVNGWRAKDMGELAQTFAGVWCNRQPASLPVPETILEEANRLVGGARNADYGHPLDDFTRTANMANALFADKLKIGHKFTAEDVGKFMCLVKLSREMNCPKRDNLVDLAGYAQTIEMCKNERERREVLTTTFGAVDNKEEHF